MKTMRCLSIVALASLPVAGTASAAPAGDAAAGKAVYTKKCASCHGEKGEGKEAIAKMMKVQMKALGSKEVQAKSDDELKKDTTQGFGKMKGVQGLSDKDAENLIAYVRSLAEK
jgi:mono/diheme cytochrome c family protein